MTEAFSTLPELLTGACICIFGISLCLYVNNKFVWSNESQDNVNEVSQE